MNPLCTKCVAYKDDYCIAAGERYKRSCIDARTDETDCGPSGHYFKEAPYTKPPSILKKLYQILTKHAK